MNVGYLHTTNSMDELTLACFEQRGCERIVVDNSPDIDGRAQTLKALVDRLGEGDALVVYSMADAARSMPELVEFILELVHRDVRFRSVTEGFDTRGKHRTALTFVLRKLCEFQEVASKRRDALADTASRRRVGRPKALTDEAASQACALIKEGKRIDEVAKQFRVCKTTLYRYIGEESGQRVQATF